jgi:hypothetical protein
MNTPSLPVAASSAQSSSAAGPQVFSPRDRITVATPCYDYSLTEYYHTSLRSCLASPLAHFRQADGSTALDSVLAGRMTLPNDSHIDRARNVIANLWYQENKTDWLLWIDADIEFTPADIARLFTHAQHGHKFLAGLYAMKCLLPTFVANVRPGSKPDPESGLIEVLHAGTGFLLIHRSVLTDLQKHPRITAYDCPPNSPWAGTSHYNYFQSGPYGTPSATTGRKQWQSEDWMLCELWRELGGQVLADTNIKLRHLGRLLFPPSVSELQGAFESLLRQSHPAIKIETLRQALAAYKPA